MGAVFMENSAKIDPPDAQHGFPQYLVEVRTRDAPSMPPSSFCDDIFAPWKAAATARFTFLKSAMSVVKTAPISHLRTKST